MNLKLIALFLLLAHSLANAQLMQKSHITADSLQYSTNGNFRGCGINLRFLENSETSLLNYATLSINFSIENIDFAVIKTTLSKVTFDQDKLNAQKKKIGSTWFRLNKSNPLQLIKNIEGEEDSILGIAESSNALTLLSEILLSKPQLQLGIKELGKEYEIIMYGQVTVKDEDKKALSMCFKELDSKTNKKK